jgi:molybdopterin synthase catalytic subunit
VVEITSEPIDPERLIESVRTAAAGGLCVFCGDVRRGGPPANPLVALEYSAHEEMALRKMEEIRQQALDRYQLCEVAVVHRLGRLEPGQTSVCIAVSAPHRRDAFTACRFIIDTLKKEAPIWKKEMLADGKSTWAAPERSAENA